MSVRLDQLPPLASRPRPPRIRLWLALLGMLMLLGAGLLLLAGSAWHSRTADAWGLALGVPLVLWSILGLVRALLYIIGQHVANDWDHAREVARLHCVAQGRRCLQVMAASVHTALREPSDVTGADQMTALLDKTRALKAQASRTGEQAVRHSRLGSASARPEAVLEQVLALVLADLAPTLLTWPDQTPLTLLLTLDSSLPEHRLQEAWQQVWTASGIRQVPVVVSGAGLEAVDQWLDRRHDEQGVWLVIALQLAPQPLDGSAEVASGLLLGNQGSLPGLSSLARLHRPEQVNQAGAEQRLFAARQALEWGALPACDVAQVWCAGLPKQSLPGGASTLTTVLDDLDLLARHSDSLCDLDSSLGCPGQAAPWLAIACAAQCIKQGAGPQLIFSGTGYPDDGPWCAALTPVAAHEASSA